MRPPLLHTAGYGPINELSVYRKCRFLLWRINSPTIFQLWEWGFTATTFPGPIWKNGAWEHLFLLVEATVCCQFYYWNEVEVVRTTIMQSTYTSVIKRYHYWNGMVMTATWLSMHGAIGFYFCHDNALKFDWCCQLSGSGSKSLNSQKLPRHFSCGLGARLILLHSVHPMHKPTHKYTTSTKCTWRMNTEE